MWSDVLVAALVVVGTLFMTFASIGVLRMPDVYLRMHAPTKAATLGLLSLLLAVSIALWGEQILARALVAMVLVGANNPVSTLVVMRAAYRSGVRAERETARDEYEDFLAQQQRPEPSGPEPSGPEPSGPEPSGPEPSSPGPRT